MPIHDHGHRADTIAPKADRTSQRQALPWGVLLFDHSRSVSPLRSPLCFAPEFIYRPEVIRQLAAQVRSAIHDETHAQPPTTKYGKAVAAIKVSAAVYAFHPVLVSVRMWPPPNAMVRQRTATLFLRWGVAFRELTVAVENVARLPRCVLRMLIGSMPVICKSIVSNAVSVRIGLAPDRIAHSKAGPPTAGKICGRSIGSRRQAAHVLLLQAWNRD